MNETDKSDNFSNDEFFDFPDERNSQKEYSIKKTLSKYSENNNNMTSSIISSIKMFNDKDPDNLSTTSKRSNSIYIKLKSDNSSLKVDFSLLVKGYPDILNNFNYETKTLILEEKWIDHKNLKDYFTYVKLSYSKKLNESLSDLSFNFKKLSLLANYFKSDKILDDIIKYNLEPNINMETSISFINDAFKYCSENLNSNIKSKWFTFFLKLRDFIIENFVYYLEDKQLIKFQKLDKKLLAELVETFLFDIYTKGIEITSDNATKLVILITYLREDNNIIESEINYEKVFLLLKNSILINSIIPQNYKFPVKPTYSINIMKDISFNYQEKLIQFYKQECIFISIYNKNDDSFSISLKLNPINNIEAFSFISYAHLIEESENNNNLQVTYHTINSNSIVTLYTINNFRSYIMYMRGINDIGNLILEINLKFCVVESFIICYLKSCFQNLLNETTINLIPHNIFNILIANINNNQQYKEEDILKVIENWLSGDLNYRLKIVNIQELFDQIDWKKIPLGKIFEFIIKYPLVLDKLKQTENDIISSLFTKANEKLKENNKSQLFSNRIIDDDKKSSKRKNTQFTFEGDNEKFNNENDKGEYKETKTKENTNDNNNLNNENIINNNENQINLLSYLFVNLVECSKKLDYYNLQKINKKKENNLTKISEENYIQPFKYNNIERKFSKEEKLEKKMIKKNNNIFQHSLILQDNIKIENEETKINLIKSDEKMPTLDIEEYEINTNENKEFIIDKFVKEKKIENIKNKDNKYFIKNKSLNKNIKDDNIEDIKEEKNIKVNHSFRSNYSEKKINDKNNLNLSNLSERSNNSNKIKTSSSFKNKSNFLGLKKPNSSSVKIHSIVFKNNNNIQNIIYESNNDISINKKKENN